MQYATIGEALKGYELRHDSEFGTEILPHIHNQHIDPSGLDPLIPVGMGRVGYRFDFEVHDVTRHMVSMKDLGQILFLVLCNSTWGKEVLGVELIGDEMLCPHNPDYVIYVRVGQLKKTILLYQEKPGPLPKFRIECKGYGAHLSYYGGAYLLSPKGVSESLH